MKLFRNFKYHLFQQTIEEDPPALCDRCSLVAPNIRVNYKEVGELEYICYKCRYADEKLKNLPIGPQIK